MKIQISFYTKKIFRSMYNENTHLFLYRKNFRLVLYAEKFPDLYLMKIQICFVVVLKENVFRSLLQILKFKEESNLKLRHVNQLLNNELNMRTWLKSMNKIVLTMNKIKHTFMKTMQ